MLHRLLVRDFRQMALWTDNNLELNIRNHLDPKWIGSVVKLAVKLSIVKVYHELGQIIAITEMKQQS